jgi:hypothetical protein
MKNWKTLTNRFEDRSWFGEGCGCSTSSKSSKKEDVKKDVKFNNLKYWYSFLFDKKKFIEFTYQKTEKLHKKMEKYFNHTKILNQNIDNNELIIERLKNEYKTLPSPQTLTHLYLIKKLEIDNVFDINEMKELNILMKKDLIKMKQLNQRIKQYNNSLKLKKEI